MVRFFSHDHSFSLCMCDIGRWLLGRVLYTLFTTSCLTWYAKRCLLFMPNVRTRFGVDERLFTGVLEMCVIQFYTRSVYNFCSLVQAMSHFAQVLFHANLYVPRCLHFMFTCEKRVNAVMTTNTKCRRHRHVNLLCEVFKTFEVERLRVD